MTLATPEGMIDVPRQYDDDGQPRQPSIWAVQLFGMPPPYDDHPGVPISLPYHATDDVIRLRAIAERLLPRWQLEVREVWVAQAITHDDALALFKRWGW